ncbi:MAG: BREX-1 system phosphatase PglZ type A, partial [Bacillota bacterium]
MELKQIQAALIRRFNRPLPTGAKRQIVFWYDDDGTFKELVDRLDLESVKTWRLEPNNSFATKYQLEVADPGADYLVYAGFPRPVQHDNWLIDTLLYSTEFSADRASIVMNDLGVQDLSLKPFINKNIHFFDNKERYQALKNLFETGWARPDFELGMMAVACREKALQLESIVKALFLNSLDEEENTYWAQIGKWPGHEVFWEAVGKEYGFHHEQPTLKKLLLTF